MTKITGEKGPDSDTTLRSGANAESEGQCFLTDALRDQR